MTARVAKFTTYSVKREQDECTASRARATLQSTQSLMPAMPWYCLRVWTLILRHLYFARVLQVRLQDVCDTRFDADGALAYHAVKGCELVEGQWIAIIGCGGLGHLGMFQSYSPDIACAYNQ